MEYKELVTARRKLGARLRELRKSRNLSQSEVSLRTGLASSFLSSVERGMASPGYDSLLKLAESLDVSVGELMEGEEIALRREIEDLLARVPARRRVGFLRVIRDAMMVLSDALSDPERSVS